MPKIAMLNQEGAKVGEIELSEAIFASEINESVLHLVVRSQLAAKRQGTQSAKTRGEVRGGGRKIYRQKGTGNARHHGNRAPQFTHGGVVFAPKPRDYVVNVPKKVRRLALKGALTSKVNDGEMIVLDKIALILAIIGGLNWGSIGLFRFDLVAALFGGQTSMVSRIIYTLVGVAALWCISLLFRDTSSKD